MQVNSTTNTNNVSFTATENKNTNSLNDQFLRFLDVKEDSQEINLKEQARKDGEAIEQNRTTKDIVEDIISMLLRGFTEDELEAIEELLAEIKKKLKENGTPDKELKLDEMLDQLEYAIAQLQKRITGVATIGMDNGKKTNFESDDPIIQEFESRINNIERNIEKLKGAKLANIDVDNKEIQKLSTKEELDLINKLKGN